MKAVINSLREVYGLFVEDGSYTIAILFWILVAVFVLPHIVGSHLRAPLLFAGLALLLIENVARSARKH